jgi:thiol-disulfide isomerase/thioredoxin
MKKLLHLFCTTILATMFAAVQGCTGVSQAAKDLVGAPAPYIRFTMLDGTQLPLAFAEGKTAAVLFWTTWCGHSRSVIEDFEQLAKRYKKRKDVVFLAASLDKADQLRALEGRIQSQGLTSIMHAFSGNDMLDEAFIAFKGDSVPYVVLVDHRGVIRSVANSTTDLEEYLEARFSR